MVNGSLHSFNGSSLPFKHYTLFHDASFLLSFSCCLRASAIISLNLSSLVTAFKTSTMYSEKGLDNLLILESLAWIIFFITPKHFLAVVVLLNHSGSAYSPVTF